MYVRRKVTGLTMLVVVLFPQAGRADKESVLLVEGGIAIPLVHIRPGQFEMGRSSKGALFAGILSHGEQGDWATEGPVREVTISKGFYIAKYKITCKQFCAFLNSTENADKHVNLNTFAWIERRNGKYRPKDGKDTHPINVAHWDGAVNFCRWLTAASGRTVRLPTEAEWEYVARGAEGRKCPWGTKDITSWTSRSGAAVDAFPENRTPDGVVGLVDVMVGEWCSDYYGERYIPNDTIDPGGPSKDQLPVKSDLEWLATVDGDYHVQRGRVTTSTWSTTARNLGSRVDDAGIYGFRIVVELDAKKGSP
jgi:formylglycine-generating enzyme required for sulfatase activity